MSHNRKLARRIVLLAGMRLVRSSVAVVLPLFERCSSRTRRTPPPCTHGAGCKYFIRLLVVFFSSCRAFVLIFEKIEFCIEPRIFVSESCTTTVVYPTVVQGIQYGKSVSNSRLSVVHCYHLRRPSCLSRPQHFAAFIHVACLPDLFL